MNNGELRIRSKRFDNLKYGFMILVVAAFWGFGNPALKIVAEGTSPLYALVLRFFLSFFIFFIIKFDHVRTRVSHTDFKNMFIVAIFIAGAYIAATYALVFTTSTNAGFFMSTGVIYTPFVSYFILKKKINFKALLPIVAVILGVYFLSTATGEININRGDAMALLCAFFGSGMYVFTSKYAAGIDPIVASTLQFLFVGLICLPFALIFEPMPDLLNLDGRIWVAMLFMSIFCTCLAYFIQNLALRHITPTYTALVFSTEPVFGALASFFILGERLNGQGFLGAGIIMIGIVWAALKEA